jgi:membrane associated rhomboid family serine protease
MIPLRDDNPTRTFAFVTVAIIALNAGVFWHELSLPSPAHAEAFVANFALTPARLTRAPSPDAVLSVFTSMFLHGGWLHIIGNMWFLWIFGNNIEDSVGHFRFIFFYLICGVAAAAAQVAIAPDSTTPMIGASGAISGVLGAYLLLFPRARVLVLFPIWIFWRVFEVPALLMLAFWFGMQLLSGVSVLGVNVSGGVAFWAHIGGFIAGMMLIPLFKKRRVRLFQSRPSAAGSEREFRGCSSTCERRRLRSRRSTPT